MAEAPIAQLLDKLHRYLTEFQTTGTQEFWSYPGFHDVYLLNSPVPWTDNFSAMRSIQFVKTFLSYNDANWSSLDDEHKHFSYLRDQSKTYFQLLSLQIQDVFRSKNPRNIASQLSCCFITIAFLRDGIGRMYDELVKLHKAALFVDGVVFDKMAESVQHYLISALKKPIGWGRTRCDYREVEGNYIATVQKLKRFRYLVCRFSKQCTDQKKLQSVLARAGAVVVTILHMAYTNDVTETDTAEMEEIILRSSFDMSRKLSPQDQDAGDVYLEVLPANVEIVKALKPMESEDMVESFVRILQLAQNQVHVLGEILDSPTMELIIEEPGDHNEQVEALLKQGYAAVAREAGSLCLSNLNHAVLKNLLHKLNLIKGELFVLELHNHKACLTSYRENRTTTIKEAFRFLSHFLKTTDMHMEDMDKLIVSLIEGFLVEVGSLGKSHQTALFSEAMIIKSSVAIFKLFKAETLFLLLSHNTSSLKVLAEFRIETLHKSFIFLTMLLSVPPRDNLKEESVSTVCRNLASKAACCVSFFEESHRVLNQPVHMIQSPGQGPLSLFNNFPKNDGVVFAEHLQGKLRKLVTDKLGTVALMHDQVDVLLGELEFLVSFLKDVKRNGRRNKDLGLRVTWLIYDFEYVVDMFILGDVPLCYHQLVYFIVIEEAKLIRLQIPDHCCDKETFELPLQDFQLTLADETRGDSNQITDEVIVGFDDQAKIIGEQLQNGSEHLQVVSLVGMAGIGKTTLAEKVCRTNSILHHFAIRARCSVSQVYRKRELLLEILGDCTDVTDEIEQKDDDDLALKVKQKLHGKRYLIVVDDIWSIEHWDDLILSFPDDITGSRILLTTRDHDVARKANPEKEPYVLHLLSPLRSWDLLQGKLFQGGECPPHLLKAGRLVAARCRGLPLAIVVIAGILTRKEMKKEEWEEIAENLKSHIADDQETQFMDTLEFSYNHLPCYLKPCYLYLGSFLEDQEISVRKLLWLWIGEGFIPDMDSKSLEETAGDYFEELMNRSLVMEARKSSSGGTKTFRIHDMLRDLCLRKAKEENFMQLISMNDSNNSKSLVGKQYRLCVHSSNENFIQLKPSASHVHSLLFFATNNTQDNNLYDISSIVQDFKLLRVLDLEPITASVFPSGTDLLLCLHYLAIKGNVKSVPSSIAKLWNLQTLIVKGTWGDISLPSSLWSMDTLRHVHIRPRASLTLQSPELEDAIEMKNLITFSCPAFSDAKVSEEILKRWTRLKKMKCIFLKQWDGSGKCNTYPAMELLTNLESLNLYCGGSSLESEISFPVSLKKLTLSRFCLPWDYMSVISQLYSLEVLKLLFKAFEGDTWAMKEETFPKLKVLMFENLNLATWNNSLDCSDHFPELQRLVLWNCKKFGEVPISFGEVSTLEMVEVQWCSRSAANSVRAIWEQQLDFGNQDFQVLISPPEWDFRRSS